MQSAQQTLSQLKASMASKGDMPSLTSALARIVDSGQQADSDEASLANLVLGDFAISQKVLRLANTPMYASFGTVTTISRALYVLGSDAVVHLAMGLKMLDNLGQSADTDVARDELSKAVAAGAIARSVAMTVTSAEGEAVAVATLMRSLGKLLVCFYLPDQFREISETCTSVDQEDEASTACLGISYASLAESVARTWNLPTELVERTIPPGPDASPNARWMHHVTDYSRGYVDAVSRGASDAELQALSARYAELIGADPAVLMAQSDQAVRQTQQDAGDTGAFRTDAAKRDAAAKSPMAALIAGINEIDENKDDLPLTRVMSMAAEVLWTSLGCRNALFFVRNSARGAYDLILAQGDKSHELVRRLSFEEAFSPNVVHLALTNGSAVYLANAQEPNIQRRIPDWMPRALAPAQAMFILPFVVRGKANSVLILDWALGGESHVLTQLEQEQIERLRTLVVRCFERSMAAKARAAVPGFVEPKASAAQRSVAA